MATTHPVLRDLRVPQVVSNLEEILTGFRAYKALKAALDLGLFELLEQEPGLGREEIVRRLKINGMFIRSFLQALVDTGLITQDGDAYQNTETAEHFLVQSSPLFQGDWINEETGQNSWWDALADHLQKEKPEAKAFDQAPRTEFIRALGQALHAGRTAGRGPGGVPLGKNSPTPAWFWTWAGGHGLYAIALCQLNPQLRGVVYDKPHVLPELQRFIDSYQMADRLKPVGGNIDTDDIGSGYDIIIVSHLMYKFRKDLPGFLNKVRQALRPDGLLVSNHWFCAPGCIPNNGLAEMDKAFLSFGHPLCYIEKFHELLEQNGFSLLAAKEIPSTFGTSNLHLACNGQQTGERAECCSTAACCSR